MANLFHPNTADIDPDTEPGCGFMGEMLSGLADDTATGIVKWYATRHVEGCPRCSAALTGLKKLRVRLQASGIAGTYALQDAPTARALRLLDPARQEALEEGWNEIDKKVGS